MQPQQIKPSSFHIPETKIPFFFILRSSGWRFDSCKFNFRPQTKIDFEYVDLIFQTSLKLSQKPHFQSENEFFKKIPLKQVKTAFSHPLIFYASS